MELGTIESILQHTKLADFFYRLCDAIIDIILFMCFDAILGCDIFGKKRLIRCDFDCDAIAIPGYKNTSPMHGAKPQNFCTFAHEIVFK